MGQVMGPPAGPVPRWGLRLLPLLFRDNKNRSSIVSKSPQLVWNNPPSLTEIVSDKYCHTVTFRNMGRDKSDKPTPEALRQRRYRDRKSLRAMGMFPGDMSGTQADDATNDPASDAIAPPGLIHARRAYDSPEMPTDPGGTASLEEEQALWVRRRRQITELQLEKQRGDLIPILEARQQMAGLGRRIRSSLDRIKNSLPPHLSSEMRPICERAIAEAVAVALEELRSVEA